MPEGDWISAFQRLTTQGLPQDTALTTDPGGPFGALRSRTERQGGEIKALPLGDPADPISQIAMILAPILRMYRMAPSRWPTPTIQGPGGLPNYLRDLDKMRVHTQDITPEMVGNIQDIWPRQPIERDLFKMLEQLSKMKGQPRQPYSAYTPEETWQRSIQQLLDWYKGQ